MGRGVLMAYVGIVVGRLVVSGGFGDFVQQHMKWPLLVAAVFTVVLGLSDVVRGMRERADDRDRSVGPVIGWLLAAPLLVLVSVAPAALGAAAADRVDSYEPPPPDSAESAWNFPDDDPFELQMYEFVDAALWDEGRSLEGREVILEGIVVNDPSVPDGFVLVRFMVSCCAADGLPLKVALHGSPQPFENDQWVRATVTWRPTDPEAEVDPDLAIQADIVDVVPIEAPDAPYESPY